MQRTFRHDIFAIDFVILIKLFVSPDHWIPDEKQQKKITCCQMKINRLVSQIIQFKGHYHDGTSMVVIFKIDEKETSPKVVR